jgi:hypothetical protein
LGAARPIDLAKVDLVAYRGLQRPWNDWEFVVARGRFWAQALSRVLLEGKEEAT